jgi:hypothetical protein
MKRSANRLMTLKTAKENGNAIPFFPILPGDGFKIRGIFDFSVVDRLFLKFDELKQAMHVHLCFFIDTGSFIDSSVSSRIGIGIFEHEMAASFILIMREFSRKLPSF